MPVLLCLLTLLSCLSSSDASEEHWNRLLEASKTCFGNRDIKPHLLNWKERQEAKMGRMQFLEFGAKVIQEIEAAELKLKVMKEKEETIKQSKIQDGIQGIEAFFEYKNEMAELEAALTAAQRKFEGILKVCGEQ